LYWNTEYVVLQRGAFERLLGTLEVIMAREMQRRTDMGLKVDKQQYHGVEARQRFGAEPDIKFSELETVQVFQSVLVFPTEIVLPVLIFPTEIVLTVLRFLAELFLTVLMFPTEIALPVLTFLTETVLTVLIFSTELVLTVLIFPTELVLTVLIFLTADNWHRDFWPREAGPA
jgi:hypothetical protein